MPICDRVVVCWTAPGRDDARETVLRAQPIDRGLPGVHFAVLARTVGDAKLAVGCVARGTHFHSPRCKLQATATKAASCSEA